MAQLDLLGESKSGGNSASRQKSGSAHMHADKSPAAFRTISEVADEIGVPQHVLRFWENKFTQITPVKRRGGRRYYRPEDVGIIRQIKTLLYEEGYTIKGALKFFSRKNQQGRREKRAAAQAAAEVQAMAKVMAAAMQSAPLPEELNPAPPQQQSAKKKEALEKIMADLQSLKAELSKPQ